MIVSKTPLRVSFLGGGTDYPSYFKENSGSVLGTAINKYVYITSLPLSEISDQCYRLTYRRVESVNSVDQISHPVVRECLKYYNIDDRLNIGTMSDLPGGTGLGSSSSFTVGFINLLHFMKNTPITKGRLAEYAIDMEQNILKENVGVQDQYHAAFGGFSKYEFTKGAVSIRPLNCSQHVTDAINKSMVLVYTGIQRNASDVLASQEKRTKSGDNNEYLKKMHSMVQDGVNILESSEDSHTVLTNFGKLLHQSWCLKKSLGNSVSNTRIDEIYEYGMKAGAWGGKLLGAGGGGFVMFLANSDTQNKLKEKYGTKLFSINIENNGSQVMSF